MSEGSAAHVTCELWIFFAFEFNVFVHGGVEFVFSATRIAPKAYFPVDDFFSVVFG